MNPVLLFVIIILIVLVLPEFITTKRSNNRVPAAQITMAIILLLAFFLPWLNADTLFVDYSVSGYSLPTKLLAYYNYREESGNRSVVYFSYILYLIPVFSIVTIILGILKRDNDAFFWSRFASLVPIVIGVFTVIAKSKGEEDIDFLKGFDIGFYLTIIVGFCLWISSLFSDTTNSEIIYDNLTINQTENKIPTMQDERSNLLNQLTQLHGLKETQVISEEIYEEQRLVLISKLEQLKDK